MLTESSVSENVTVKKNNTFLFLFCKLQAVP